jgi:hypothetical protein
MARVGESYSYETRATWSGLAVTTGDYRLMDYRIPKEWGTLTAEQRAIASKAGFKQSLKGDSLVQYEVFQCGVVDC